MRSRPICSLNDCESQQKVKGYCSRHYQSLRKKGLIQVSWKIKDTSKMGKHVPKTAFKKGEKTWNTGKKNWQTSAHKEAIKAANLGREPWNKGTVGVMKAWNKGTVARIKVSDEAITPKDKLERNRFREQMQSLVFKRDNYTCQICDSYGGSLQVDHIKRWSEYPELRFEMDNCRTLCMACHYYITFKRKIPEGITWGHGLSRRIKS